jgi:hypothetical protein
VNAATGSWEASYAFGSAARPYSCNLAKRDSAYVLERPVEADGLRLSRVATAGEIPR